MAADLKSPAEQQSLTGILSGILNDFQKLMTQQMEMMRAEVRSDWEKTKQAIVPIAIGSIISMIGGLLLSLMLVFLLWWGTAPAGTDPAGVPLWGSFAIIGAFFLVAGGAALGAGIHKFRTFNPLPEKSAEALKENVQWLSNPK